MATRREEARSGVETKSDESGSLLIGGGSLLIVYTLAVLDVRTRSAHPRH